MTEPEPEPILPSPMDPAAHVYRHPRRGLLERIRDLLRRRKRMSAIAASEAAFDALAGRPLAEQTFANYAAIRDALRR